MKSQGTQQEDWFAWAETFLADCKARDSEWTDSFTPAAAQVLAGAGQAARSLNHDFVGAEHLLAGIAKFSGGAVATALKDAGISLGRLKEEIMAAHNTTTGKKVEGSIPYTPRCKGIVARARARSRSCGGRTDVEDLLLELLAEKEGLPASIIRKQSIDVEKIKSAIGPESGRR